MDRETKKYFVFGDLAPGGWGATPNNDGLNASYNRNGNCMDLTPEIAELFFPVYCLERSLISDSGGPGKYRGGLASRQTWQIVGSDNASVSQLMTRTKHGAMGMNGGMPGKAGRAVLNPGEKNEKVISGRTPDGNWKMNFFSNLRIKDGDSYSAECPGGGGWGNPLERDPKAVMDDVLDGFVSRQKAKSEYGVVLTRKGDEVDVKSTKKLRRELKKRKNTKARERKSINNKVIG
jgi:N-methylhydantoinase B